MKIQEVLLAGIYVVSFWGCQPKKLEPVTITSDSTSLPGPTPIATPLITPTSTPQVAPPTSVDENSPTNVIQKYTDELRQVIKLEERTAKGKKDQEKEQRIAQKVRQFFDFEGLAKMSLGHHWHKIAPSQRQEFSTLFIDLVEDSYIRRSRDLMGEYQISYNKEVIRNNSAKVSCKIVRNDADIEIQYELHRKPKDWMIFNIVLDSVDLIKNYQSQFNRIIGKSGFNELIKLMRKKLSSPKEEATL